MVCVHVTRVDTVVKHNGAAAVSLSSYCHSSPFCYIHGAALLAVFHFFLLCKYSEPSLFAFLVLTFFAMLLFFHTPCKKRLHIFIPATTFMTLFRCNWCDVTTLSIISFQINTRPLPQPFPNTLTSACKTRPHARRGSEITPPGLFVLAHEECCWSNTSSSTHPR